MVKKFDPIFWSPRRLAIKEFCQHNHTTPPSHQKHDFEERRGGRGAFLISPKEKYHLLLTLKEMHKSVRILRSSKIWVAFFLQPQW
jgi:hypothetical protein